MSFYNMLFGRNPASEVILSLLGLRVYDVERFRDCAIDFDEKQITIYARTGGGNREDYPQEKLTEHPLYVDDQDDEGDRTYATFVFSWPPDLAADIPALADIAANGAPASIVRQFATVMARREPHDIEYAERSEAEARIRRSMTDGNIILLNGHTLVPLTETGFKVIAQVSEGFDGKPPGFMQSSAIKLSEEYATTGWSRLATGPKWVLDEALVKYLTEKYGATYPKTVAHMTEK